MSERRFYKVADHVFSVAVDGSVTGNTDGSIDFFARCMDNYEPFGILDSNDDVIPDSNDCVIPGQTRNLAFALAVHPSAPLDYTEEIRQKDEGQSIICGHTVGAYRI